MTLLVCSFTIIIFLNTKLTLILSLLFDCKHLGQRPKDRGIRTARTDLDLLSIIGIHSCLCGGGGGGIIIQFLKITYTPTQISTTNYKLIECNLNIIYLYQTCLVFNIFSFMWSTLQSVKNSKKRKQHAFFSFCSEQYGFNNRKPFR